MRPDERGAAYFHRGKAYADRSPLMFGLEASQLLATFGYGAVGFLVFIEDFGIPSPGETVMIAGAMAAAQGDLNVFLVALAAFTGAVLGDNVGYAIGRYGGRRLVLGLGHRIRIGRHHLITGERLDRAQSFFHRYGSWIIAVARFIEGLRQLNGIIAGTLHYGWVRFLALNALGAFLWVSFWTTLAYYAGDWVSHLHGAYRWAIVAAGLLVVGGAVVLLWLWRRRADGS